MAWLLPAMQTDSTQGNRGTDRTDLRYNRVHCPAKPTVGGNSLCTPVLSPSRLPALQEAEIPSASTAENHFMEFCAVLQLLYHICNPFASTFRSFFPFFIEKVQLEIQKKRLLCGKNTENMVETTANTETGSRNFAKKRKIMFFRNRTLSEIRAEFTECALIRRPFPW